MRISEDVIVEWDIDNAYAGCANIATLPDGTQCALAELPQQYITGDAPLTGDIARYCGCPWVACGGCI